MPKKPTAGGDHLRRPLDAAARARRVRGTAIASHTPSSLREAAALDEIGAIALPEILEQKPAGDPIRAWVVGCSTGGAVYSLAIALMEQLDESRGPRPVLVFGTDVDERAIERARAGVYPDAAVAGLGEDRLKRFFVRADGGWRIGKAVRERCVFARHDVVSDPPFAKLDLLSCRTNLLHLSPPQRRRVLATAHYALGQPGFLLLGRSGGTSGVSRWFAPVRRGSKLLRSKPVPSDYRFPPRPRALAVLHESKGRRRLEEELASTKAYLGAVLEEHRRGPRTRTSARDGLAAGSDQLQATYEELTTVNDELQRRNQDLQLANADILHFLDAVEVPILILDEERRVRRFTRSAEAVLGLAPADVGRPLADLALGVEAPDLERWIDRATAEATLVEAEVQDGTGRWHHLKVRPRMAAGGRPDGTTISLMDIHDLKHRVEVAEWARDYSRSIVEAVPVPLVVLGADLHVLSANAAYYQLLRENAEETEGQGFFEIGAGEWEAAELRGAVSSVLATGGGFQGLDLDRTFPAAGLRSMSVSGCLARSLTREPMILLAIEDVTERRRNERHRAELLAVAEEAKQRAERADAAKDLFLANLSHELRGPLAAILLHAEMLQSGGQDASAVQKAGAAIQRSTKRQARLIEELLDVSRIVSGKLDLEVRDVDLRGLVLGVLEGLRPTAEAKAVQLQVEIDGDRHRCPGDPARLEQVVENLVSNAIKFTPREGRVGVRVDAVDGHERLVVTDSGRGIAPAFLPRVFERFAQEDDAPTFHPGLGLGLAIVHHLVDLHGGTVHAESPGRDLGSTFTVTLPRRAPGAGSGSPSAVEERRS